MSLLRFTRTSQPQQSVGIDWANPNTKNLFFACDRFGQNYAGRINHLGFSGTRTDRATPKGVGRGGGGTGYFTGPAERSLVAPTDAAFSIVGTFALGATGQTNKYLAYDYRDVTSQAAVIFGYVANTLEFYCDSFTGTNPRTGSGIVVNDTLPHTFGYSYDGTNWIGYLDGVRVFSTTRTFSCNMPAGEFTTSLLSAGGGNTLNASILQWTTFDKGIGEQRLKSLTANPWQIWLPTNRAIYPAAAGSTYTLTADAASYSITGADASLIVNRKLIADTANIPIAGADATLTYTPIGGPTYTLTADAGSYAITGNATGLAFNRVLTADAGSYSAAGQAVGLAFNRVLSAATANIPVAGQDATLTYTNNGFTYTLSAEAGAFNVTGQDARLAWSGEQTGYTNEVVLKPWYIRRNKKILLFGTAQEADAYIEAEEVAEQAIQEAQKTSRRARKRLRDKLIKVEPIQTVDVDQLTEAVQRFSIPVDLPKLIAQQDYERVMQILALAADMQDEEDVEMLLLM